MRSIIEKVKDMKADPKIRAKIVRALKRDLRNLNESVKDTIKMIENSETVEDIMSLKQDILMAWVQSMPLSDKTCYFCVLHKYDECGVDACTDCEYAQEHLECPNKQSDFNAIINAKMHLLDALNEYYRGEEYEQETS